MIKVLDVSGLARSEIKEFPTFSEAVDYVRSMGVAFMQEDRDFVDCADAYMEDGRLIAVQPDKPVKAGAA